MRGSLPGGREAVVHVQLEAVRDDVARAAEACPAGAISGTGFSNEQIFAQLDGLLLHNVRHLEPAMS